jgi:SOS-response transcriptional repressor LexA
VNASLSGQFFLRESRSLQSVPEPLDCVMDHAGDKSILRYATQAQNHTTMCGGIFKRRHMERTPDERREILRHFIQEQKAKDDDFNVQRWAKLSGVDKNSIYNFLNGHSKSLDGRTYGKLARTLQVPVHRLTGDMPEPPSPTAVWVTGTVEAGEFREAIQWDHSRWYAVDVPVPDRFRRVAKALEVQGNSMNLEYLPGSVVIWVDMLDFRPPRDEDHVIVYAYDVRGHIEATVKEYRITDGKRWLWPRSSDPAHQVPIDPDNPPEGIEAVEVKGIVLGGYRPRVL